MAIRERLITALITTYPDLDVLFMLDANALVITLVLTSPKYKMVVNEQLFMGVETFLTKKKAPLQNAKHFR